MLKEMCKKDPEREQCKGLDLGEEVRAANVNSWNDIGAQVCLRRSQSGISLRASLRESPSHSMRISEAAS